MNQKLERFLISFEKKNKDPKLANFLNEVLESLDGEGEYIAHLELDAMQYQIQHKNKMEMMQKNQKLIINATKTLNQFRRAMP